MTSINDSLKLKNLQKKKFIPHRSQSLKNRSNINIYSNQRNKSLSSIKNKLQKSNNNFFSKFKKKPIKKMRKTFKRRYKFGKQGNKVSVLIKNNNTRKKIEKDLSILKNKSINEVKEYLRKHNLLKIGSYAPNYILRQIYQDSHLTGKINNNSDETLIYNFINES